MALVDVNVDISLDCLWQSESAVLEDCIFRGQEVWAEDNDVDSGNTV